MFRTISAEEAHEIAGIEFTPKLIRTMYDVIANLNAPPEDRADAIYLFVNKCITQRRPIRRQESDVIVQSMVVMLPRFKTIEDTYWMVRVLLDLYEVDQHVLDLKATHVVVDWLMHVMTDPTDMCCLKNPNVLMNCMSALITLVSCMFCYGFHDLELEKLGLPIAIERPTDAKDLSYIFQSAQFCRGIIRILLYATTTFDKWFARDSLFHWDLAILATVVKNNVLRFPVLCENFDRIVIEKLFDNSSDYTSIVVLSKASPLAWKRPILECVSIVLTGSSSYILGIALVDQTSGARRFSLFMHALLKHYETIAHIRKACMENPNASPQPVARAVTMLMALSGRDRSHIARMIRRLNHHVETSLPRENPHPSEHAPPHKTDEDFIAELVKEEEEERRRSSVKSNTSSSTTKKKKKAKAARNDKSLPAAASTSTIQSDHSPSDEDDDDCIYVHYQIKKPSAQVSTPHPPVVEGEDPKPIPFGTPVKKRPHRKRKPIHPLSAPLEPVREENEPTPEPISETQPPCEIACEPVREENEPTPEPVREENEPTPEPVREENEPTPEPVREENEPTPEPVREENEPTPEPVREENEPTPEPVPVTQPSFETEHTPFFKLAHVWATPFPSHVMSTFIHTPLPDRTFIHPLDVLRWTPLVYAHSVRASFEKSVWCL